MGMLYLFQLPLIIVGLFLFLKERTKSMMFMLSWLLLSPVAAITGDAVPHSLRSFTAVIPFTYISTFALLKIYSRVKIYRKLFLLSFSVIFIYAFFTYLHDYYIHHSIDHSSDWQYGYREAALRTAELSGNYERINISGDLDQAYIFWLFNLKYDPSTYIKEGNRNHFGMYYFKAELPDRPNVLFVGGGSVGSYNTVDTIYSPKGEKIVELLELNENN